MARKQEEQRPVWELSNISLTLLTSLMIILLAFFIMLTANSAIDEKRELKALGSLVGSFGILPKGLSPEETDDQNLSPPSEPLDEIKSDIEQMKDVLNYEINQDKMNILKSSTSRIISLREIVLFPRGGVEILPEMEPALSDLADIIRGSDYSVIIEGHTDDQPPANEALVNNWYVSAMRAANILKFFIRKGNIDPSRLSAYGYGGFRPAVANNSPRNRDRNRRIDIILETGSKRTINRYQEKHWNPKSIIFKGFIFKLLGNEEAS